MCLKLTLVTIATTICLAEQLQAQQAPKGSLKVTVSGIPMNSKTATIILFDNEQKMTLAMKSKMIQKNRKQWKHHHSIYEASAKTGSASAIIKGLPPGEYSIMTFCDQNGNNRMDTNFIGFPTEPIGMSGSAMLSKPTFPPKQKPSWKTTKFRIEPRENQLNLKVFKLGS